MYLFYLSCFNHIELYDLPVSYAAEEFSRIVFLNGSLKRNGKMEQTLKPPDIK